ncbi:MAG: cobalamin-independent methionine synthase II family protein [Chloroflexi bacterium]|nr:cobalamin-independent methionine synthase II family protein [Chloroflexota bacterium]
MQRSTDRILTTHAGRLSERSQQAELRRATQSSADPFAATGVSERMAALVRRQIEVGVDVISDGELGKFGGFAYYGRRLSGITTRKVDEGEPLVMSQRTNERLEFAEFYAELQFPREAERMVCTGPLTYTGQAEVQRDISVFNTALQGTHSTEQFMCVLAPGWIEHSLWNEYYPNDEAFLFAIADAMKHEYRAIVDAGFVLQLDDPGLPDTYDMIVPAPSLDEYRRFAEIRVEALNHALEGLPEDRVRYHICWGSWHGPHTHDLPLRSVVDLMLRIRAGAYSLEAGNPRHEHEWKVWRDVKLPPGKILIPGVVSHASNVVEHPELVADRIIRYAELVGRENVIAGTDCGMGGRVHPQIGWAKLDALVKGAELASQQLWGRPAARTREASVSP